MDDETLGPFGPSMGGAEERYRRIFESTRDAILLFDAERDAIVDANDQACRLLKYSRDELLALPISATHPDDLPKMREFVQSVRAHGAARTRDLTCVTKLGERVPAEVSASVLSAGGRTLLLGLVRPAIDDQFQKLFSWLFELSPHATLAVDEAGRISLVNRRLEALFGYSRAELLGRPVEMLVPGRFHDAHVRHRDAFERAPRMRPMGAGLDLSGRRKDGGEFPVDIELSPVTGTGLVLTVVRDVSDLQSERREVRQRMADLQGLVDEHTAQRRRSEGRHKVVLDVNNAIVANLDRESLFAAIAKALRNVFRFDRACLMLADTTRGVSTVHALVSEAADSEIISVMPIGATINHQGTQIGRVLEERRPLVIRDWSREPAAGPLRALVERGIRSGMIAPLVGKRGPIGTVNVLSLTPDQYSDDDAQFLAELNSQIALAIENMLAHEEIARLKSQLEQENLYLQEEIKTERQYEAIVGHSVALRNIAQSIETVAATEATVLITGETGTGKEVIARAVHSLSSRRAKTMVKVNCAALSPGLVESELFGHEKGAFTGAVARKIGRFEVANGSTIFLDEIGDLPLELQGKLLRVLQEGEFERVGSSQTIRVDVRVIAATNHDLDKAMREGQFRQDLYYRLSVFPISLPPLRDRKEDIAPLVRQLLIKYCSKMGRRIDSIPSATMGALQAYSWPGNVRELENVIERAVIVSRGPRLDLGDWAPSSRSAGPGAEVSTLEDVERRHIKDMLDRTGWIVSGEKGAARLLGLKPTTLEARMKKLGIIRTG